MHEWILSVNTCHDKKKESKNGTNCTQLLVIIRGVSRCIAHKKQDYSTFHRKLKKDAPNHKIDEEGCAKSQNGFNLHKNSCVIVLDYATRKYDQ